MFVFNISYYPVFSKFKDILSEMYLLLITGREQGKVFKKIPIIEFRRAKSLKQFFAKVKIAPLEKKKGCCKS